MFDPLSVGEGLAASEERLPRLQDPPEHRLLATHNPTHALVPIGVPSLENGCVNASNHEPANDKEWQDIGGKRGWCKTERRKPGSDGPW